LRTTTYQGQRIKRSRGGGWSCEDRRRSNLRGRVAQHDDRRAIDRDAALGGAAFNRPRLCDRGRRPTLRELCCDADLCDFALRSDDRAESSGLRARDRHRDTTVVLGDRRSGDVAKNGAILCPGSLTGRIDDERLIRVLEREGEGRVGDRLGGGRSGRRDHAPHPRGDEDRRHRRIRAECANSSVGRADYRSAKRVDAHLEGRALHGVRRCRGEHCVATAVADAVRDDVPARAGHLAEDEVDIATIGHSTERLQNDLRVGLKDDKRSVEERERGVRSRRAADRVTLLDEVVRRRRCERARRMTHFDCPLENRETRARRDDRALRHDNARRRRDQEKGRSEGGRECERSARALLGERRYRDERNEGGCVRVVDRITNFGEGRRDDLELDASEHVLGFVLGRLVQRIGHRKRRGRAPELDQGDGAQFAEPAGQLTKDGGLGRDAEGSDRVAAYASERARESLRCNEAGSEDRIREGLLAFASAIEVLDLSRAKSLL
jgi:hypothetical protein